MSSASPWQNIPSSEDNSKTLIGQSGALLIGSAATIVAVFAGLWGFREFVVLIGHTIMIAVTAYVLGIALHFWASKVYIGGMSKQEIVGTLGWPLDFLRAARGKQVKLSSIQNAQYGGAAIIEEGIALFAGFAVTVVAVLLGAVGIILTLKTIGTVFLLIVVAYYVGAVVQFWVAQSWKDGLTVNEAKTSVTWPFATLATVRRQAKQAQQPMNV